MNAEAKGGKRRSAKSLKTGSDKLSDGPETFSSLISAERTKKVFLSLITSKCRGFNAFTAVFTFYKSIQ